MSDCSEITKFWFNSEEDNFREKWFQRDPNKLRALDIFIKDKFGIYLTYFEGISHQNISNLGIKDIIDGIICLDQFSRHIYRSNNNSRNTTQIIDKNTQKASELAKKIIYSETLKEFIKDNIEFASQLIPFILMPLKHEDIYINFNIIHHFVLSTYETHNKFPLYVHKFYYDSLKKYYLDFRQFACITLYDFTKEYIYNIDNTELKSVCQFYPSIKINTDSDISTEPLYKTVDTHLKKLLNNELSIMINSDRRLVVSLSGGVDSMVMLYIIKVLTKKYKICLEAFHINYKNRYESDIEENVIKCYCEILGIKLYVYRFNFLKRNMCERKYYENLTRTVRFKLYNELLSPVVLGHIKDDLIENIWTNLSNGKEIFKLHKIEESCYIGKQPLLRPFFRTEKKKILNFAHKFNINYLKDTTPSWSNRGKLRAEFLPAVKQQFGDINDKLLYISDSLSSYHDILNKALFKPFLESVRYHKFGLSVDISSVKNMPCHFWHETLTKLMHSLNTSMVSIKSIQNFSNEIKRNKTGIVNIKKDYIAYIGKNEKLHILNISLVQEFLQKKTLVYKDWKYMISNINIYI